MGESTKSQGMNRITFSCILLLSLINIVQCKKYLVEVEDKKGDNAKENEESMRHSINALEAVEAELGDEEDSTEEGDDSTEGDDYKIGWAAVGNRDRTRKTTQKTTAPHDWY